MYKPAYYDGIREKKTVTGEMFKIYYVITKEQIRNTENVVPNYTVVWQHDGRFGRVSSLYKESA